MYMDYYMSLPRFRSKTEASDVLFARQGFNFVKLVLVYGGGVSSERL